MNYLVITVALTGQTMGTNLALLVHEMIIGRMTASTEDNTKSFSLLLSQLQLNFSHCLS